MLRVGVSFRVQVFITVLNLAVDDAWAEAGDDTYVHVMSIGPAENGINTTPTGSSVAATSTEPIAPITTIGAHGEVLGITIASRHHSGLGSRLLSIGHMWWVMWATEK